MKINKIIPDEHIFTQILGGIANPPNSLCYIGTLPETRPPVVAVIGTRKPTPYGIEIAQRIAYDLAKRGIVVVSGLALGIDALAHKAALEAGGTTIGLVVNALPDISPRTNVTLAKNIIASGGAIMSEWRMGDEMVISKWSFLQRNRLVSGIADAVIVIEAAAKSGTLNTVGHALNQGREVFAVPGNVTSPLSEGCNTMLKQGAHLVTEARDVIEIIAPQFIGNHKNQQAQLPIGDTPAENILLQLLAAGTRNGEQLQQRSNLAPADFAAALTMLEVNELIKPLGANQWTVR